MYKNGKVIVVAFIELKKKMENLFDYDYCPKLRN